MNWVADLQALFGADEVALDEPTRRAHGGDKWFAAHDPEVVVFPRNTEQVSRLLRFASERQIPVTARGAGYGYVGGCVPMQGGIALSLERMNRIKEINFADAVAVVEPGVITGELQAAVRAQKLFYPPDPASLADCSIGGNIATNAGGPRCLKYGVTRHYVLGLEVVLAERRGLAHGRPHAQKQNRLRPDRAFRRLRGNARRRHGNHRAAAPASASARDLVGSFATMAEAAAAVQAIFAAGFLPSSLEIADPFTLEAARAEHGRGVIPEGNAHLLVDLDGQEATVRSEAAALEKLIAGRQPNSLTIATTEEGSEKLWDLRREFSNSLRATGLTKLNEDIVVPRSRLVDLVEFAGRLQARHGFPIALSVTPATATSTSTSWPRTSRTRRCRRGSSRRSMNCSRKCSPGAA